MRPKGEIHRAMLTAVRELRSEFPDRGATLREITERAKVGKTAARHTIHYLARSGALVITGTRREAYRNRPVSEYALPAPAPASNSDTPHWSALGAALTGWHGGELRKDQQTSPNDAPCG